MGPIGCTETSVINYYSVPNNAEERISHLPPGRSLKSRTVLTSPRCLAVRNDMDRSSHFLEDLSIFWCPPTKKYTRSLGELTNCVCHWLAFWNSIKLTVCFKRYFGRHCPSFWWEEGKYAGNEGPIVDLIHILVASFRQNDRPLARQLSPIDSTVG